MSNPYQPPSSNIQGDGPVLYSLQGIVIAAVIGSLAAAVLVLYLNYRSLNAPALATKTAVAGMAVYLLLIGIAASLPESMLLGLVFLVIQAAIAYFAAVQLQGGAIRYHQEHGGIMHSNVRAAVMGLATGFVILLAFVLVSTLFALTTQT